MSTESIESSAASKPPIFFSVSTNKFVLMTLSTFCLYQIYWIYKNWVVIKESENSDIKPFWRAVFAIIYCLPLFRKIAEYAKKEEYEKTTNEQLAAVVYVVTSILNNFASKLNSPIPEIGFIAYPVAVILSFLYIQELADFNNSKLKNDYKPLSTYSVFEKCILVIGGLLFALALCVAFIGLFRSV